MIDDKTEDAIQRRRDALQRRRAEVERERGEALAERKRMRPGGSAGPVPVTIPWLLNEQRLADLEARLAEVTRECEADRRTDREQLVASRKPRRLALLAALMSAAEAVIVAARAVELHDAETAAAVGLAPGPAPIGLGSLPEQLNRLRREIEGPAPKAPAPPPRSGERRVRLTIGSFHHREALHYYARGDVFDLPERDARDLIKSRGAVEVAAA